MSIYKQIKRHFKKQHFVKIARQISSYHPPMDSGYIVAYNDDFVVLQEVYEFKLNGFYVFPIHQIVGIRYNDNDRYYDKIMHWEGLKKDIQYRPNLPLKNWKKVFKTFKKQHQHVIVECEHPKQAQFIIGSIIKVTNKQVYIRYFNAQGILENYPTNIKFKHITKVTFEDHYIDTFQKYLRYDEITEPRSTPSNPMTMDIENSEFQNL